MHLCICGLLGYVVKPITVTCHLSFNLICNATPVSIGLDVTSRTDLMAEAKAIGERVCSGPTKTYVAAKESLNE